jgi:flagellar biosynthesis anti-sigma factor FlgM
VSSIDRLAANAAANTYQVQNSPAAGTGAPQQAGKAHHGHHQQAAKADSVSVSDSARSLASAREAVQNAPDVREQKVADIKQRVADGTYSVPARVLARKMLPTEQG